MTRTLAVLACCAALACGAVLAACSSTAGPGIASPSVVPSAGQATTPSPSASASAEASPGKTAESSPGPTSVPSVSPSATPSASQAAAPCKPTTKNGTVGVEVIDFDFKPMAIKAKVGQIVTFTNTGFELHAAALDAGDCQTPTLETGKSAGLLFTAAGSFPFHCAIHGWMTGTITIRR